ncbi:MAG: TIGR03086 family metal-binding protein [Streptosporangiaceae bacterium]
MQLTPGELALPTPCQEWDLRMLLGHLGESMADLEEALRRGCLDLDSLEPRDPVDPLDPAGPAGYGDDPVEMLRDRAADLLFACYAACGQDRFVLVGGLPLPAGIVACTGAVEIAVHGWDVCAARGRGGPIPPRLAGPMLRLCPLLVAGREGLFGEPVEASAQASPGDQLVAYLGRVPRRP